MGSPLPRSGMCPFTWSPVPSPHWWESPAPGKGTLARLLVGMEPPDQGTISLDGEDTSGWNAENWRKRRTKLQAVFQDASGTLNPMRSVRSNVEEAMVNLTCLSKRQRRERIGELMELTHMEERLLDVPARQLSGGEQRRLSLVRAMSIRPKYLILDEVLSGLDLISADAVMRVLEQYHREFDCAFLLITHDMDSAYRLSDTILTMPSRTDCPCWHKTVMKGRNP